MHRLLLLIFVFSIFARINGEQLSYFERRKQMLNETKIILHPRPSRSVVDHFYYGPQKPRPSNYQLLINEDQMCSKHEKVFLFVAVRTIYTHYSLRKIIREALNHYHTLKSALPVTHAFLLGKTNNISTNKLIKEESSMFRDILQADFLESYGNLTLKTLLAWNWSCDYCPNAEYVMIMNDELFIDMDKLVPFLFKDYLIGHHDDRFALCNPVGNGPAVHRTRKQFTVLPADDLYKGDTYPFYCHGYGYVAHIKTISKLLKASVSNPYFMPDDVWIGVLSEKLRLQLPNHRDMYAVSHIEEVFASNAYYSSAALIAVTDHGSYKGHERDVMQNVISSMRKQWQKLNSSYKGHERDVMQNVISSMRKQWQKLNSSTEVWSNKQAHCSNEQHKRHLELYLILLLIFVTLICVKLFRLIKRSLFGLNKYTF